MKYQILQGDNRETLKNLPDNSVDAIVTDPPYGIGFLGKDWDSRKATETTSKMVAVQNLPSGMKHTSLADDLEFQYWMRDLWLECYRVLKPGGHVLAFSAARTYHHMAMSLQTAGFEIRDQIMWIYSSGFPKSQDVGKSIDRQSGKAAHKTELSEVKAILRQLYEESGKSTAEIARECGFNAGGYLKTDFKDKGWANNLPKDDKWLTLKSVLGCGDEYDDYFVTTPQVKIGEKESGCFDQEFDNYTIGARSKTVDVTQSQTEDGKTWSGWGTALKPAHEPIALARKPIKLSIARNCQQWGTGALNIDATRVPYEDAYDAKHQDDIARGQENATNGTNFFGSGKSKSNKPTAGKRTASFHNATGGGETQSGGDGSPQFVANDQGRFPSNVLGEIAEPYQKYFYCPKVSRRERHIGFEDPGAQTRRARDEHGNVLDHAEKVAGASPTMLAERLANSPGNNHPTVKPIELMKYLIKLVTPKGGVVLDPFNGSGSTGCAAVELGHEYIGCELDPAYVEIALKRIAAWNSDSTTFGKLFE